jgi:hypothetical protein
MQVAHLASVTSVANKNAKTLCDKIDEKVDNYANGDLDHAVDGIIHLWKLSKGDGRSSPVFLVTTNSVSQPSFTTNPSLHRQGLPTPGPASRRPVEIALIKSIREGIFFDRKCWTRDLKTARDLRPLYISSIAAGESLS